MAKIVFDDGKSVELSKDTVRRLKKELGVPVFDKYVDGYLTVDVDVVKNSIIIGTGEIPHFYRGVKDARLLAEALFEAANYIEDK